MEISQSPGGSKSETSIPVCPDLVRTVPPPQCPLQTTDFSLVLQREENREEVCSLPESKRTLMSFMRAPPSWPYLMLITSQGLHGLMPSSYEWVGFPHSEWVVWRRGGDGANTFIHEHTADMFKPMYSYWYQNKPRNKQNQSFTGHYWRMRMTGLVIYRPWRLSTYLKSWSKTARPADRVQPQIWAISHMSVGFLFCNA